MQAEQEAHLSHAIWAHRYALALSSSERSAQTRWRESDRRELARSMSSRGIGPVRVGISPVSVFSRERFMPV